MGLLAVIALCLIVFTAIGWLTLAETKELASVVLAPLVAVTGTAVGFYFGGESN